MPVDNRLFQDSAYGGQGSAQSWLQNAEDARWRGYRGQFDRLMDNVLSDIAGAPCGAQGLGRADDIGKNVIHCTQ
jgi:hypothetical protein